MEEFNTIEEILEDIRVGKPVVILDDEGRENEGDIIFAAEHATTENVNFMAKYARGLHLLFQSIMLIQQQVFPLKKEDIQQESL